MRPLLPFFIFATAVSAADPLPEVVITATRSESDLKKLPSVVRKLDKKQIDERLPRTFPEALRETPGVAIQKTANGQGSPFIRGFTGFRNLILVDGIRYNNSTFREGPNQYWALLDPLAMERIEVIPSQGSVLYGSDAIGGTVNTISKSSGFGGQEAGRFFMHGLTSYRWSSAENSHVEHLESSLGQGQKWGLHVGGTLNQFGDVKPGQGPKQANTGYDQWAFDVRLDVALDDQWLLTAAHQQSSQNDVWRTHSTTSGISFAGTTIGTDPVRLFDQQRSLSYLRLTGKGLDGWIDAARLTISLQTQDETQFRVAPGGVHSFNDVDVTTLGADLQFESLTSIGKLVYGADFYHDWVESDASDNPVAGAVADDSTYSMLGIFIQDEIDIGDRLHVILGGRYTHVRADAGKFRNPVTGAQESWSDEWDNFSANVRLLADLDAQDRFQLFGGWSQSFRAPNLSDLTRFDVARSEEVEIASTDLDAEQFLSFEAGARLHGERAFTGQLSVFHTLIDDLIQRTPTGESNEDGLLVRKTNSGDGYVQGVEAEGRLELAETLSLRGMITWMKGEIDSFVSAEPVLVEDNLSRVMPLTGQIALRHTPSDKGWVELVFAAGDDQDDLSDSDRRDTERIPPGGNVSYEVFTLRGNVALAEDLNLSLAVENLFDTEYRLLGSGVNEPGRNFVAAVDVRF